MYFFVYFIACVCWGEGSRHGVHVGYYMYDEGVVGLFVIIIRRSRSGGRSMADHFDKSSNTVQPPFILGVAYCEQPVRKLYFYKFNTCASAAGIRKRKQLKTRAMNK
jgi:hypothetical protein